MPEALLEMVRGLRQDVTAMRQDVAATREQAAATRQRVDAVAAELAQHRKDDRRELDTLTTELADQRDELSGHRIGRWRLLAVGAVGLAGALVGAVAPPVLSAVLGS